MTNEQYETTAAGFLTKGKNPGSADKPKSTKKNRITKKEKPNVYTHEFCNIDIPVNTRNIKVRKKFFTKYSLRKTVIAIAKKGLNGYRYHPCPGSLGIAKRYTAK